MSYRLDQAQCLHIIPGTFTGEPSRSIPLVVVNDRIERPATAYEIEAAKVEKYGQFVNGFMVGAIGFWLFVAVSLATYKYFGWGGIGVLVLIPTIWLLIRLRKQVS